MAKKSKIKSWKKAVVAGALATSLGLGFWASKAFYTVTSVIDGDTFITKENRYVRFDSVNAPELDNCLGKEAKEELSKLVLNRKVFLKTSYVDDHKRLIASVYTTDGNVGEKMLAKGLATFKDKGTQKGTTLANTQSIAKKAEIGVFSPLCTQLENPVNSKCNIKGNNKDGVKTYHYPGCSAYKITLVQLYLGDKWFCTQAEAKKAGFT
ncbi:MAG: thermonuclease family protein, partial [Candidatus Woesebacteria bacterium]|nr:thermonuclease family protein [Candidatus Woesebacteria bacterium]